MRGPTASGEDAPKLLKLVFGVLTDVLGYEDDDVLFRAAAEGRQHVNKCVATSSRYLSCSDQIVTLRARMYSCIRTSNL